LDLLNPSLWIFHAEDFIGHPTTKDCKTRKGSLAMLDLLPVESQAPEFSLPATDGQPFTLSELAGRKHVVLVFYVGDNTPD
jgi:cytochrome oxidase Cu insertion factor (SCO1/SenC/PrrC family)